MLDRYGLIGKKVESGSDVILAYRFVNLKTNEIIEVLDSNYKNLDLYSDDIPGVCVTSLDLDENCDLLESLYHVLVDKCE